VKAPKSQLEQRVLVLVTLALVAFGLVMVYSATSAAAALGKGDPITFLKRQGIYALLGVALMLAASRFDHRRLRQLAPPLVLTALGLCAAVLVVAPEINGAKRWLDLGPASFQPSELAKLALLVWAAVYLARKGPPQTLGELWRPIGMLTTLFAALIMLEPDLGTTISLSVMLGGMLVVAGVPGRTLAAAGSLALFAGVAAIWMEPYRRARVFSFLDPWKDPASTGYQIIQSQVSLGSGGWLGVGLGEGRQKWGFLPEAHTDFIFAIIGEELGLVGAFFVVALFAVLGAVGLRVAAQAPDTFGRLMATGITTWFCVQAFVNIGAVIGILPITGVPLPFISFGSSAMLANMAAAGMLCNICRASRR